MSWVANGAATTDAYVMVRAWDRAENNTTDVADDAPAKMTAASSSKAAADSRSFMRTSR